VNESKLAVARPAEKKVLEPPDTHYLRAAEGWLMLGCVTEAQTELQNISLQARFHPRVLMARYEICARKAHWELAYALAQGLVVLSPQEPAGWINRSIALHALKRTPEAWYTLLPAAEKFPKNVVIAYNLACYGSQMGRFSEANQWLKKATEMDKDNKVKWMAVKDPDLMPLWEYLGKSHQG
jgi:tetratricopeptide (TPR) repeat protein